jgi:predicted tellurium resistance membrane protein TerC
VIAVAAAANGQLSLLILGLAISIPMIIAGAALIMMVLDRFPILIWLGATLLGWIAGDVIETDPAIQPLLHRLVDGAIALNPDAASLIFRIWPHFNLVEELVGYLASLLGAITVLVAGSIWRKRKLQKLEHLALPEAGELAHPVDRP